MFALSFLASTATSSKLAFSFTNLLSNEITVQKNKGFTSMPTPYIYQHEFELRFADLDPYGHLNSSRYLDLLVTSRLLYPQNKFGLDLKYFMSKDVAYYMSKVEINYLRPIIGLVGVKVQSWVEKIESKGFQIEYKISSPDDQLIYANGKASIVTVSLSTGRSKPFESWMLEYLFEDTADVSV